MATVPGLRGCHLRGHVFESWVASEIYKDRAHRGLAARIAHYRDAKGPEIDLVCEVAGGIVAVEAKSGATVVADLMQPLERFMPDDDGVTRIVILGGADSPRRGRVLTRSWRRIHDLDWT